MEDSILIEQSAKGNTNAFRLLVIRYQRLVFSLLGKFLFPAQVQEDLAQETFLRAFKNIAGFDAEKGASFSTWLATIARNLAINEASRKSRRREQQSGSKEAEQGVTEVTPQDILERRNLKSRIHDALGRLPENFRAAVVLSYLEELPLEEIARIEGCPVGTVKSRVFRGKQILRQMLDTENVI